MRRTLSVSLLLLLFPLTFLAQGVSCPAVVAGPDTTLNCNDCVRLTATPVSGFTTTTYTTQPIPYSPYPYNAGTPILVNIDDVWGSPLPIGFDFCFYGNTYTQCVVGSNGVVSFDLASYPPASYCAWPITQGIPGNNDVLNSILGPFHDIDPSVGGSTYWAQYGQAPCRVFVVSFYQIPMFSCNNVIATQQIVLYETTNIIEVYIQNRPSCSGWNDDAAIEGIQDAAGANAVAVPGRNFPTVWTTSNDAYSFVPAGAPNYTIAWYEVGNPVALTNLDTITVCPPGNREYYAEVIYTNCNGATVTVRDTATINASTSSMVLTTTHANASCNGATDGTAGVTVTGTTNPYTILWSSGQTTANISGLAAGNYIVTVSEQGGCSSTAAVIVTQPAAITLVTQHTDVLCNGLLTGAASVAASGGSGGFTYLWSNGATTPGINGLAAGTYGVTVTDANACTATASVTIIQPTPLVVTATATDVVCFGGGDGTAQAFASGGTPGYQYNWNTGDTSDSIINLQAGNYTVTVTDANGCIDIVGVVVNEAPQMTAQIVGDTFICDYDSVRLSSIVTGGLLPYSYLWTSISPAAYDTNASLVFVGGESRIFRLEVRDQNGCSVTTTRQVISNDAPLVSFYADRQEACDSLTVQFVNISFPPDCSWLWEFSDNTTNNGYQPTHFFGNGQWSVGLTATNNAGCTASTFVQNIITILPTPEASFVTDPNITLVDYLLLSQATVTFNNTSPWYATSVDWEISNGDSAFVGQFTYTFLDTGWYCIKMNAYNDFGCHDEVTQCILIKQDPFLWVPTGFTPNGDGINDFFQLGGVEIRSFEMSIFDRWGRLIFVTKSIEQSWDGKAMGQEAPEGAYVFKIDAMNKLGEKFTREGTVTLVR
jgi:large repetitive protein